MTTPFRRRVDNLALRWQARLDSEWADRVLPWALTAALFVLLAALSLAKARSLDGTLDLAAYTQATWLIRHGEAPLITVLDGSHLLAQHAAFAFYPMTAVSFVLPIIPGLLALQAALLSVAVVPLWKIARRLGHLRAGAALALVTVYGFYAVMHNLNLDGFHPEVLAVPGLLAAFYFAFTDRWRLFALCCIAVLACRADLGLVIGGLGVLLALSGKRRIGLITALGGIGWMLVSATYVQTAFGDGSLPHLAAFAAFGDSPAEVAWGILTHPGEALGNIVAEQNFLLFVTLFAPLFFLPLLAPRYLIPIIPLELAYLVADAPREAVFGQQTVAITAFIFIASIFALSRIGRKGVEQVTVDHRILGALVLSGLVFFVTFSASSPYRLPWEWGSQDAVDGARLEAKALIDRDASVRASSTMLQELAERQTLYPLPTDGPPDGEAAIAGVDVVVVDVNEADDADERRLATDPGWSDLEYQSLITSIRQLDFRVVYDELGVVVLERNDPG